MDLKMTKHDLQTPQMAQKYPPKYLHAIGDIFIGYLFITILIAANIFLSLQETELPILICFALFVGILNSFLLHYLFLFLHEASHYNLLPHKGLNDFFANILVGFLFLWNVKVYRKTHWDHHLKHGKTDDPENSYFNPLSKKNILLALIGLSTVRKISKLSRQGNGSKNLESNTKMQTQAKIAFTIYQLMVFCIFAHWGAYLQYILTWVFPLLSGFPVLSLIRQTCEHRRLETYDKVFESEEHGAYTRVFKKSFFAYFFGGAGFRQHWYHHFNPYVSYTRLEELAQETKKHMPEIIHEIKEVSYLSTFAKLTRES
jgi:fatty acid desaturase